MISREILFSKFDHIVVRSVRGQNVVRRDPRELPRRVRVLLLAIDGAQNVQLYVETLRGFGDIAELLMELLGLGLIELLPPETAQARFVAKSAEQRRTELDSLLDDSRFNSQNAADVLYGATTPGSFDEMVRVARIEQPDYIPRPPAPPPAPVQPDVQHAQVESLFALMDAMRGERRSLKARVAKMERIRQAALRLEKDNHRLTQWVYTLSTACVALTVGLVLVALRR